MQQCDQFKETKKNAWTSENGYHQRSTRTIYFRLALFVQKVSGDMVCS
jgi:hypothetical protein